MQKFYMEILTNMLNTSKRSQRFRTADQLSASGRVILLFFLLSQSITGFSQADATLEWANAMPNQPKGGYLHGNNIKVDADGNTYVTGYFEETADFDPGPGVANLTSAGERDIIFAKYDATGNYVYARNLGGTYDDEGNSIAVDVSGNVYLTGYFQGTVDFDPGTDIANLTVAGEEDEDEIFFAKYDASGNYVYARGIGGTYGDIGYSIAVDGSGNVYLTGYFQGTVDFDPGTGTANLTVAGGEDVDDIFFAKYDASGNYVYARRIGDEENDGGFSIAVDGSGNVYVTGYFQWTVDFDPGAGVAFLTSAGDYDIFFAKYDASGNYVYAKRLGGTETERGKSIAVDGSGNVYVTGYFAGTFDFDPGAGTVNLTSAGAADIFFAKYNASGNYVYAKRMGGTNSDNGNSIAVDGSGNVYVTGYFAATADFDPGAGTANLTSVGSGDIFFAKYDASGSYVYARSVGGTSHDNGYSIAIDGSGNVYLTGYFKGTADFDPGAGTVNLIAPTLDNAFVGKYNSSGNYVWAGAQGGYAQISDVDNEARSVAVDNDGNTYITGKFSGTVDFDPGVGIANLFSAGDSDIFFAKYDASGDYVFAGNMGGSEVDVGYSIAVDGSGNVYVTGSFRGTADFDPGAGTANLTSVGDYEDIFFAKYDAMGIYVWARGMGETYDDRGFSIALDGSDNVYITGSFQGTVDFDPGAEVVNLISAGSADIFFAKYDANGDYLYARNLGGASSDVGYSIAIDGSGNVFMTGFFQGTSDFDPGAEVVNLTSAGNNDIFFAKYDASGNYLYAKGIGGTGFDKGNSIAVDVSGNVYMTGDFYGTADFDPGAEVVNLISAGSYDIFFSKYDASGNFVYARNMGGTGDDKGFSTAVDGSGNVYLTGTFQGIADFNPGTGVSNLTSFGGTDIFFAKYGASGNYMTANKMGGTSNDYGYSIAVDGSDNVYVTGYFNGTADFDPGAGTFNLTSLNGGDIFLASYTINVTTLTLTTDAVTAITSTTATGNGDITNIGSGNATNRGIIHYPFTGTDKIIGDANVTNVSENGDFNTGAFTASLTGLSANTRYNARAHATNAGDGTKYGDRVDFWTLANVPSAPTVNNPTATSLDVTVNANSNPSTTEFAIHEATPTKSPVSRFVQADGTLGNTIVWATAATWTTKTVTGLTTGTEYTFEVKARNGGNTETAYGTSANGTPLAFPTVTTQAASAITSTSATGNGNITATNGVSPTNRGVIFYLYSGTDKIIGDAGVTNVDENGFPTFTTGAFTRSLTGLSVNTRYNARAHATNTVGTGYGSRVDFWTLANVPSAPTVNNPTATTLDVTVNANSNPATTEFAIHEASPTKSPVSRFVQADGTLGNTIVWATAATWGTKTVTGLTTGTEYTFEVKARNGGNTETAYGATASGTPLAFPTVTTQAASDITATNATGNGNITATNGINPTNRGVIYYLYSGTDKIIGDAGVSNVDENGSPTFTTGAFTRSLTGLSVNTRYNARAHATNTVGTGYGSSVDFWTLANVPDAPTVNNPTATSLNVAVNENGNPESTLFAIQDSVNNLYLKADGTRGATAVWQTATIWGTKTVSGLSTGVTYYFRVKAKNGNDVETAFGLSTGQNTCSNPTDGGEIGSDQTVSEGQDTETLTNEAPATGHGGTLEYKWQSSTTSNSEDFEDIADSDSDAFVAGPLNETTWFKRLARVTCKADWTGAAESNVVKITVLHFPEVIITAPAAGSKVYTNLMTITGTAADSDGNLSIIEVKLNGGSWQTATGTDNWTIDFYLAPGKNTIFARACDATVLYSDTSSINVLLSIQIINIPQGWSAISSYLTPQNPALPVMMDEITDNNNLVIMLSENGVYWPSQNYNTIGNWNVEKGYKVKMNNAQEFTVRGDTLTSRSLSLSQGYHIIPVLTNAGCPITSVFADPLNDILFMYDVKTNAFYWPQGEIFSLTTLEPGKGYIASFNKAVTLTYPAYSGLKTGIITNNTEPELDGPWALVRTGDVHFISIKNEALNKLENASFIGAFDSFGSCIGYAEVDGSGDNYLLSVYGNDETTDLKDGGEAGEFISFRSYNSSSNSVTGLIAEFNTSFPNADGLFASNGQSAIISFKESPTGIGETGIGCDVQIYPNPAKDELNIAIKGFRTLRGFGTLMTADGKLVKTFSITGNQTQLNVQDLQPGIYMLRIENAESVVVKRLVIQ